MHKRKAIPQFKNEDDERLFWAAHDSADFIDWSRAERAVFPNLKRSTKPNAIRLPEPLLNRIKTRANRQDVPYQSYIKTVLDKAIK